MDRISPLPPSNIRVNNTPSKVWLIVKIFFCLSNCILFHLSLSLFVNILAPVVSLSLLYYYLRSKARKTVHGRITNLCLQLFQGGGLGMLHKLLHGNSYGHIYISLISILFNFNASSRAIKGGKC